MAPDLWAPHMPFRPPRPPTRQGVLARPGTQTDPKSCKTIVSIQNGISHRITLRIKPEGSNPLNLNFVPPLFEPKNCFFAPNARFWVQNAIFCEDFSANWMGPGALWDPMGALWVPMGPQWAP